MTEPTIKQLTAQIKFYKGLSDDLIELIYYRLDEEILIKYLLAAGYKAEEELINTLMFDCNYVEEIVEELTDKYEGERLG
jgi:hypothetical protein